MEFAPPEIVGRQMHCSQCGEDVSVPMNTLFDQALVPVIPLDYDPQSNNKYWAPAQVHAPCPNCRAQCPIDLPQAAFKGRVTLFGDEAFREGARRFFCLAAIGGSDNYLSDFFDKINQLKIDLEPKRSPLDWRLHMTELHSGQRRRRHTVFQSWSQAKCEGAVGEMFKLLRDSSNIFKFITASVQPPTTSFAEIKRKTYVILLSDLIFNFTKLGFAPDFFFDAERAVPRDSDVIQQWARAAFTQSQRQLLYLFISHGIPITEPLFVQPGSLPPLEVADFVSFVVAREFFCRQLGKPIDYRSAELGDTNIGWLSPHTYSPATRRLVPWDDLLHTPL